MSKRSRRRRYYNERDDYEYYPRRRRGCLARVKRFFTGVFVGIVIVLATLLLLGVIFLGFLYRRYLPEIFLVIGGVGGLIVLFYLVRFVVEMIASIAASISEMRLRAIAASKAKVDLTRRKAERDTYRERMHVQRDQLAQGVIDPQRSPRRTRVLPDQPPSEELPVSALPSPSTPQAPEPEKSRIPDMPDAKVVYYRDVVRTAKPGELIAYIRGNGTARLSTWRDFKIVFVLGGSSSGKTTTMVEKILGFTAGGGLIVPCDPHAVKEDSLFNRIYPLKPALYPGATFAVKHEDALKNMRLVKNILNERVDGADVSVPVLLVVEELNRLMRDKLIAKEIAEILEMIGQEGRGFNVYVIIGGQRITYLSDIRKSIISFIVHRSDESEAQLCIPRRYAKYATELGPGQCYVKDADGITEAGLQVLTTLEDVEQAAMHLPVVHLPQKKLHLPAQEQVQPSRPTIPIRPRPVQKQQPQQGQAPSFDNTYPRQPLRKHRLTVPETEELAPNHQIANTWGEEVIDEELIAQLFDIPADASSQTPPQPRQPSLETDALASPVPGLPEPQTTAEHHFSSLIRLRQQDKKKS